MKSNKNLIKSIMPAGLECGNCLMQWIYVAGNNWGKCDDGTEMVGCGPQEQFRACSDISIGEGAPSPPLRPMRPATKATQPTKASIVTKVPVTRPDEDDSELSDEERPRFVGLLIALFTLLFVVCCMIILYFYHYHGQRIKRQFQKWRDQRRHSSDATSTVTTSSTISTVGTSPASNYTMNLSISGPVPPPRTKRLTSISADDSNVLSGMEKGKLQK